jgi:hypothetical protein
MYADVVDDVCQSFRPYEHESRSRKLQVSAQSMLDPGRFKWQRWRKGRRAWQTADLFVTGQMPREHPG